MPVRLEVKASSLPVGLPQPWMTGVLRDFDPDVVHLASPFLLGAGGLGAAFALGQVHSSYPTAQRLERASGLPVIGSITEVLTATRAAERARRMRWLVGGAAALGLLYVVLLVVEYFQRGLVA